MKKETVYTPQHNVRIVTAASLFDGHDAAINIMRRIMQRSGCEVIHLGHDRSVDVCLPDAGGRGAGSQALRASRAPPVG